jgi:HPt (histidine-containing phosphotransfer) domain-containing protein
VTELICNEPERYDARWIERLIAVGGCALVDRLVAMFVNDAPGRLEKARGAAFSGDAMSVETIAHSLKSSTAQLGLVALAVRFERAERACGTGDLASAAAEIVAAAQELPGDIRWLRVAAVRIGT